MIAFYESFLHVLSTFQSDHKDLCCGYPHLNKVLIMKCLCLTLRASRALSNMLHNAKHIIVTNKKIMTYSQRRRILKGKKDHSRWRCQMETTSSNGNIFRVTGPLCGEFFAQKPVTRGFDVFFDLRMDKRLSKQSWGYRFQTSTRPLLRHCNVL